MDLQQRYRFGTLLVWTGVLVWIPYIALRIAGGEPSLWAFLPVHLAGVVGGGRLRASARRKLGIAGTPRKGYKRMGQMLIIAGILAWLPYFGLKLAGQPAPLNLFLGIHLSGMLGGIGVLVIGGAVESSRNRKNGAVYDIGHPTKKTR